MTENLTVGIIPGDGIGRDVTRAARIILNLINERCADISFVYKDMDVGEAAIKKHGSAFPDETREGISNCDVILFGAIGAPHDFVVLSGIRYGFNLFANVRPIKSFPGVKVLHPDADLVVIDPKGQIVVRGKDQHTNSDYSLLEGWTLQGRIEMTLVRGEIAMRDGVLEKKPGFGHFIGRNKANGRIALKEFR